MDEGMRIMEVCDLCGKKMIEKEGYYRTPGKNYCVDCYKEIKPKVNINSNVVVSPYGKIHLTVDQRNMD